MRGIRIRGVLLAWLFGVAILVACSYALGYSCGARAEDVLPGQLDLARSYVAEAGWPVDAIAVRDYAAMSHIHWRNAQRRRIPLAQQVREYCAVWAVRTPRSRWVLSLNAQLTRPDGWPRHARWDKHRRLWRQTLKRARFFLENPYRVRDPCRGRADAFGGEMDTVPPHWRRVDCGETRQRYWDVNPR